MSEELFTNILKFGKDEQCLKVGDYLFHQEEAVKSMFILTSGSITLSRKSNAGHELILSRAQAVAFVAEASLYSGAYHCDAVCSEPATLVRIPKKCFRDLVHNHSKFSDLWSSFLARELQNSRMRCNILSQKTVHDRLNIWLEWNNGDLPPKGQWKSLALEIGVSPEALYRELARSQKKLN